MILIEIDVSALYTKLRHLIMNSRLDGTVLEIFSRNSFLSSIAGVAAISRGLSRR